MKHLTTIDDVIASLGGPSKVAALCGCKWRSAVTHWRHQGFPAYTIFTLQAALAQEGLSAPPSLWRVPLPEGWQLHTKDQAEVCLVKAGASA